eukprot:RCo050330
MPGGRPSPPQAGAPFPPAAPPPSRASFKWKKALTSTETEADSMTSGKVPDGSEKCPTLQIVLCLQLFPFIVMLSLTGPSVWTLPICIPSPLEWLFRCLYCNPSSSAVP